MKNKIIEITLKAIVAVAVLLGFKVIIRDIPEEPEKEKIIFAYVDPETGKGQETDSYTVDGFDPDVK